MGNEKIKRKDFLRNIVGLTKDNQNIPEEEAPPGDPDPLFEKYARKTVGNRQYSTRMELPGTTGTEYNRVGNITSGLAPYTGPWTQWEVVHLLRRTGFGVKKTDLENLLLTGCSLSVDHLLNISAPTIPSATPLNYYQTSVIDSGGIPLGESWTSNNLTYTSGNDGTVDYFRENSLICWNWGICIEDAANIREKMQQFWYHFIPVNFDDIRNQQANSATMCHDYMALLRSNALGNFKSLIKAITKMPAMLVYLGNQYSTANVPNENYARELMELFTMGKVPVQNYTESDIVAASKVLSGWKVQSFNAAYPFVVSFNATSHNQTNKVFSSFFGNTTIANQVGAMGAGELDTFFDMLFTQQQDTIAKYVCRRLYRFFVYYDIDANIEANVIAPLATIFINNNWQIGPVVAALLKSEHFFDVANRGVMIKSPIDFIAGTLRTLKINTTSPAGASQLLNQYQVWNFFNNYANNNLEQGLGLVPNVSGWKAYYQAPTYYQNWINSNTIQRRSSLLTTLINGTATNGTQIKFDPILFVQQFPNDTIRNPDLLINAIVPYLFAVDLPDTYKSDTKIQTLLGSQVTNNYWTTAWDNYMAAPTNTTYSNLVKNRIKSLLTTFLQLAEYQLM
jgi:uncharacterized protein (DUF1800 family)